MYLIIPSSDAHLTLNCLASIEDRDPSFLSKTVIITDDKDSFWIAENRYPGVVIVAAETPFNFARWINAALLQVYDYADSFFLLNDDTELITDYGFSILESLLEREGAVPILSAAIRGTSGVIEQRQQTAASIRLIKGIIAFTAVGIHKTVFDEIGFLDERFDGYGYEDNDYCVRAEKAGLNVGVFDGCVINHYNPHSTFGRKDDFRRLWMQNEVKFHEKWAVSQPVVVVVGGSRSGAAVYSAVINEMGFEFPDKPAPFERRVSEYFRDTRLAKAVRQGDLGAANYVNALNYVGKPWGTRIWPQPEMAIRFLSVFKEPPYVVFVEREREARVRSYVHVHGVKYAEASARINAEIEDQRQIVEWARANLPQNRVAIFRFDEMIEDTDATVTSVAAFVSYRQSVALARSVVHPEFATYRSESEIYHHEQPQGFGRIAVGVRLTSPEPSFVGCYARLLKTGLNEDDVVLEPAIRTPAHWAATNLMRRFLSSGCDTLLMIDDDMTFPADLLRQMRENESNWRYDIVSALATQRVPPPRALVMRIGDQPDLPDMLNGLYYNLLVDEVTAGETMPVDGTGFAFTLIRRRVIERMTDAEWGPPYTQYVQWGEGGEGEDVNFCRRAGSHGFKVSVDGAAHVGHIGSVVYGYDEFDQWRNTRTPTGLSVDKLVELLESALPGLSGEYLKAATDLLQKAREQ